MMSKEADLAAYVKDAKDRQLSDEAIALMLSQAGWSRRQIGKALADHYEEETGLKVPHRSVSAESVGADWFLYSAACAVALTWITGLINFSGPMLAGFLREDYYADLDTQFVPMLLLAIPVHLYLMVIINKRLKAQITPSTSVARTTSTVIILLCAAIGVFYRGAVSFTNSLVGSRGGLVDGLAFMLILFILGGTMLYYWTWLRWEVEKDAKG